MSRFWVKVASTFKQYNNILGYELINEPWAGNVWRSPTLLLPGEAGRRNLAPLYDHLNAEIRKVDDVTNIFYEPVTWGVFLNGNWSGTGFADVPGGVNFRNRSVLSYHYYCWLLDPSTAQQHYGWFDRIVCDKIVGADLIPAVLKDLNKTGGSAFLTEFGLCSPDGKNDSINTLECEFVLSQADKYLQSWTYWDSDFFDGCSAHINWDTW